MSIYNVREIYLVIIILLFVHVVIVFIIVPILNKRGL